MQKKDNSFFFKKLFEPLTTSKAITIILSVGFIVYFNSLFNGFVWDDVSQIINSSRTHSILNFFDIISAKTSVLRSTLYYRPIPEIFYSLIYTFFSSSPFVFHLFQLIIHICVSILFFILFRKFFNQLLSLLLALVFLIHPFNSESVLYISALQTNVALLFGLIAIIVSLNNPNLKIKKLFLIFSLLLLSFLSKESGISFLFLIFASRIIFYREKFKREILLLISFSIGILMVYFGLRFLVARVYPGDFITAPIPIMRASFATRLFTMPKIFWFYLNNFLYPKNLLISQHWIVSSFSIKNFYLPLLFDLVFALLIFLLGLFIHKKNKNFFNVFLFFLVFFVVNTCFILQIVPLDMTVADRWFYLPMVGLLGLIGVVVKELKFDKKFLFFLHCFQY